MIQVSGLKKSFATRVLFEDVSFSINKGEIIGFVGRNGTGKSTLFKVLLGEETSDEGTVGIPKGYRLGALDQHIHFTKPTVLEECCTCLPKGYELDHYKAEALLSGLGFSVEDMQKDPSTFSGGYQLRINLVKALLQEPDLLLLDEPTNYLDILSLSWLRGFLKSFQGEVLLITHDRHFMDSVITHTMGIHRQNVRKMKGPTEKYYEQHLMDEEIYEKTRENQVQKIKEMEKFVERFGAKASKAKQAQSKMKQIEKTKAKALGALSHEAQLGFKFNFKPTPAKTIATIENLSFGFPDKNLLFSDLTFRVQPKDRIAIIGKNGHGKTTLLNVIASQLKGSGTIYLHPSTKIGYYQQTNKKDLSPNMTVAEEIASDNPQLGHSQVRSICGAMMFSGDAADKKVGVLSGGEQGRVLLGKVIAKPCNLLLLDEPTNHLDMESIQVMTEEIDKFDGAVLVVTHDEALLRQVATKLIIFKGGKARLFLGNYKEFLEKEGWDETVVKKVKIKVDRKELKRKRALIIQERGKTLNPIKKQADTLEKEIIDLEEQIKLNNEKISTLGLDSPESKALFQTIGQLQGKVASKYEKLDELMPKVEELTAKYEKQLEELSK